MKLQRHITDLLKVVGGFLVASIMKLKKENRDIWLISERRDEAEDNGYHLYKYIRESHSDQRVYYIIDKKSKDFKKIEKYGTIIQHNSFQHIIYYFLSNKHISAFQFFGVPEIPLLWKLEEMGIVKKKKIFLQHGVIQSKLPHLFFENTKYNMFVCGANPEFTYIKKNYGYPKGSVKYLGLCRYDNLYNCKEKNQIIIMPTWRQWLGMTTSENIIEKENYNFIKSEYYTVYNNLLNNRRLLNVLENNNTLLLFYPHPEMQRFIKLFKCNSPYIRITDRKGTNLQELLKESKMLITDYSSIAFDGAYMKKPIMYYQFDQDKYNKEHFEKGYFDCERDGFGPVFKSEEGLINEIEKFIVYENFDKLYIERAKRFFPLHDRNNCKRNYEEILKI